MGRMPEDGGDELQSVFSDINITPLTDIFLVLLIIFMVGASMAVDAAGSAAGGDRGAMKVDLPSGAAQDLAPGSKDVIVVILPDGRVVLAGQEVADDRLTDELKTALAHSSDSTLIVQADEGVHHGRVVAVMEKAREAGFTRLAVATRGE
ncbi:Biopolymer transport protein ExbD/TolR [Vulgatibacter incomptus]|uniref:Biopolymer transport protein ExbD/TolR n=2 Tax=Vulgatibacter incomptus TaxID=1391653 RepID=A0A0K1PCC1_9BACT|nr:Biopolymer transport protein ExbD/TolR [Vulgatibacter incomptus]